MSDALMVDYHIHCGQFYDVYYQPSTVIKCLHENGIQSAWISSTSSGSSWSNENEKRYLLQHIDDEIKEAIFAANQYRISLIPLYWVIPQRHAEGESVEQVMKNSFYRGFKVHPRFNEWASDDPFIIDLMEHVCSYAQKHHLPILIHTGVDDMDSPRRFEWCFSKYQDVKFVLAHCKDLDSVKDIFAKCPNVYGDTAFCPKDNYDAICSAGFQKRMQFGTDFPITDWFERRGKELAVSEENLIFNYKKAKESNCAISPTA